MLKQITLTAALLTGSVAAILPSAALAAPAATAAKASPLLKADELKALLGQPDVRVLDIRARKGLLRQAIFPAPSIPLTALTAARRITPARWSPKAS